MSRALQPIWRLSGLVIPIVRAGAVAGRAERAEDSAKDIRPLMTNKCCKCHHATKTKRDLNLARFENLDATKSKRGLW